MIFRLIKRGVAGLRAVADAARRAGLALAVQLRAAWRRHRELIADNAAYGTVLATVAAWLLGQERGADALMAVITALLGIVIKCRNGMPPRHDTRSWSSEREYNDYRLA